MRRGRTSKGGPDVARLPGSTSHSRKQAANSREGSKQSACIVASASAQRPDRGETPRYGRAAPGRPSPSMDASTGALDGGRMEEGRVQGGPPLLHVRRQPPSPWATIALIEPGGN
jgi:hypothetical protein